MSEAAEDTMTQERMLDKIAELSHSNVRLKDTNASMTLWLEAAENEIVTLKSQNEVLKKKANMLERIMTEAQESTGESCLPSLTDEKRKNAQRMTKMEQQLTLMCEHNEQLTSELKAIQQDRDQGMKTLGKMCEEVQILQRDLEGAQLELHDKEKVIEEKNQLLKNAEETLEEFSNTIKDLRMTSHELKLQLEERQDESSFAFLNELVDDKISGFPNSGVSYAEEVTQLGPSVIETKDAEVLVDPWSFSADFQQQYNSSDTRWCLRIAGRAFRAAFFVVLVFLLLLLFFFAVAFVALTYVEDIESLPFQLTQSYGNVEFSAAPPF